MRGNERGKMDDKKLKKQKMKNGIKRFINKEQKSYSNLSLRRQIKQKFYIKIMIYVGRE